MQKPFLRLVAEDIKTRFSNDISEISIVFNNNRPIKYLRKHLVDVYGQAIWSPQFFTIQEFLGQSTDQVIASPLTQFFHLYKLHNDLLAKEGIEPESPEEFYPIAEIILSDFSQLDYDLVPIDQIYMELSDTTEIDLAFQHFTEEQQLFIHQFWQSFSMQGHTGVQQRFLKLWRRLPRLYKAFKAKLKQEGQTTHASLYRDLADGQAEHMDFANPYKKILFVGFNALNRVEAQLFKQWQEEDRALFYFDVDGHYLEDKMQEAGLFLRRNIEVTGLHNALGETAHVLANRTDDVHLYQCLGKNAEAKLLHDVLQEDLQNDLLEGKTAAIILADESLLVPLLQSLPEMKVNITTGYPLMQSPLYGLLDLWMELQIILSQHKKDKIPYQLLETFLSHPMTRVNVQEKQAIQLEVTNKQLFEIPLEDIKIRTEAVPQFFERINNPQDVIPRMLDLMNHLLQSGGNGEHVKVIENNLLIEVIKVLNQLEKGFSQLQQVSITFQIGLIRKAIAPISSAIIGNPLEGLQIMGLLESRCLNFDRIYLLGANEGILPKTSGGATFLPNNLRKAYGLPVLENQDALSAYLFYRHFQYSEGIHLFYNGIVDEGSSGEESRFIKQMEFESKFNFVKYLQEQPIQFPNQPQELIIEKDGEVWEQLYGMFIEGGAKLSASAFTTYLQSPLQFFIKYIAGIKEPPTISQEFEMNSLGTVIHECMELLLKPWKGNPDFIETASFKPLLEKVDAVVLEEIGRQYLQEFKDIDELNSLQRIMHKIATAYIKMYLQYDIDRYEKIRIIELENVDDYTLDFPIRVMGKTAEIKLYGIIDRVDEVIDKMGVLRMRIVDYKTGGDQVIFGNLDKVFDSNTDNKALLQTLFYAYVFEQKTGLRGLEPHLYVARRMREDGTLFRNKSGSMEFTDVFLSEQKARFVDFLRARLEELFNPEIPFRHNPDAVVYPSDPYTLFYRYCQTNNLEDTDQPIGA